VPEPFLKRRLAKQTLAEAQIGPLPAFLKPVVPKQFRSAVYHSADELSEECRGLPADTAIMVSEIVKLTAEVRCFVLNNQILDAAVYEGAADRAEAIRFANEVTKAVLLPRAVVLDLGFIAERGWAVVELNAAWGAGLNGCNSEKVLPAVLAASGPQQA